jgi:Arc/MetJ family transcription regulator
VFTLIGIMNSYGMTANETARISDILFESVKWGTMTVAGLSDAIGTVAPMANAAGMELEDLMAVMSTLTRAGLSADEAGVRVNAMLKQMPREMKNALDVAKHFEGMGLADINLQIPEIRAAQGFAILGNNVAGLQRDMMMIRDSTGATEQAFKKMASTLMQWFNRVREAVRQVAIAVGEALGPGLKRYGDAAINALRGLVGVIQNNHAALVQFAKVSASIVAVGLALLFVSKMAGLVIFVVNVLELLVSAWVLLPAVVAAAVLYMTGGFDEIQRVATDAMGGIKQAMEGGDVLLAVKIFWVSVKLLWAEGIAAVEKYWNGAVVAMAKADNWIYFITSQYGIVGEWRKMWWDAVRDVKDAFAAIAGASAKLIAMGPVGKVARMVNGDSTLSGDLKRIDDALAANALKNLRDMEGKQNAFDEQRLEAVKKLSDANKALDKQAADEAAGRKTEILLLQAEQRALIADAAKVKKPALPGMSGNGAAGSGASGAPNTARIAQQIAEARGGFNIGRAFGWGAGGANTKSKELEAAEQSRDFLRRIETNTRGGTGVTVGA